MTVNLDRFAQGLPNPADARVMAECAGCGGEIYPGEDVYVLDGYIFHRDPDCLLIYMLESGMLGEMTIEDALGVQP